METAAQTQALSGKRKLRVLTINPAMMPSVVIGALRPLAELEKTGEISLGVRLSRDWRKDDIDWADVVVFYRNQELTDVDALYLACERGKGVIYEIDDNFFEIPLDLPLGRFHREPRRLHALKRFLQYADLVRVYSQTMLQQTVQFGAPVELVRSYFDASLIAREKRRIPRPGEPVEIAFASGRSPDPGVERAMHQSLARLCDTHGDKVRITFWRKPPPGLEGRKQIRRRQPLANYDAFVRQFYKSGFDIGLAPVLDDAFHNSKTNNKYREYGGCGVAGIYSDVELYRACVTHRANGMLAENTPESWYACLAQLVQEPELRRSIAAAARSDVLQNYTFENAVSTWRLHLACVRDLSGAEAAA
ncbi:MAG: glycosyltransferase [Hyphomonadaceae bacterium]